MPTAPFLPASQKAPINRHRPLHLEFRLAERPGRSRNNVKRPAQARSSKRASPPSRRATTRQARHLHQQGNSTAGRVMGKTACHPRGSPARKALPKQVPFQGTRPSKQRLSATSCARLRAVMASTLPNRSLCWFYVQRSPCASGNSLTEQERWEDLDHPRANRFTNGVPSE